MVTQKPFQVPILAVDPGKTGAAAIYSPAQRKVYVVKFNKHETIEKAFIALRDHIGFDPDAMRLCAVIEKAQASPQMGVSSAFKYGYTYAETKAMMDKVFLPTNGAFLYGMAEVAPSQWKPAMNLSRDKKQSVLAVEKMPITLDLIDSKKLSHDAAEAVLLSRYYWNVLFQKGLVTE